MPCVNANPSVPAYLANSGGLISVQRSDDRRGAFAGRAMVEPSAQGFGTYGVAPPAPVVPDTFAPAAALPPPWAPDVPPLPAALLPPPPPPPTDSAPWSGLIGDGPDE